MAGYKRNQNWTPDEIFKDQKVDGEWGEPTPEGYKIRKYKNGVLVGEEVHPAFVEEDSES